MNEIKSKNYTLVPSKYITFVDHDYDFDYEKELKKIKSELKEFLELDNLALEELKDALKDVNYDVE